ncbi:MAG: TetR/AcrR family transcriptional regulator [Thermoleophilaceae bacterium]|nr:TetR/AcrR family transcriptional regulator [Thermoleophilaceae bacterium]
MTSAQEEQTRSRLTAAERRAEILDAAMEVFGRHGYHGSSIDEIAKAAGISKALIYEHFPSKRELHASLLEHHVDELIERLTASAGTGEPGEVRLRAGVDAFFRFVEERREAWRMLFRDSADPELAETYARLQTSSTLAVADLIATDPAARDKSSERTIEMLALLLSGAVQSLANWWHSHQDVPREELVDRVMDFCWVGLRRLSGSDRD